MRCTSPYSYTFRFPLTLDLHLHHPADALYLFIKDRTFLEAHLDFAESHLKELEDPLPFVFIKNSHFQRPLLYFLDQPRDKFIKQVWWEIVSLDPGYWSKYPHFYLDI